jgi:hypothetical protein
MVLSTMACCKWLGNSRDKYFNPLSSGLRGGEVRGPTLLAVPLALQVLLLRRL